MSLMAGLIGLTMRRSVRIKIQKAAIRLLGHNYQQHDKERTTHKPAEYYSRDGDTHFTWAQTV